MVETAPAAPAAPLTELGYAHEHAANWWAQLDQESTPELMWPLSVRVYDNMRRQDAQVSSILRAVTHPIRRTTWRLDGSGCRDEVTKHVALDLGLPIVGEGNDLQVARLRDRFSWSEHVQLALLMLPFGHMFFEQVYRIDPNTGLLHLRKLAPRLPRTIAQINVARDGGLVSIEQDMTGQDAERVAIPVDRLVAYVLEREGGNWLGQSLLRSAYKNWLIKDRLLRVDAQSVDRNGMGIPVYTGAEGETDLSAGRNIASAARSGDNAGAAIPNGAELKLLGVEGSLPDAMKSIRYHDEQIARAALGHFLNLGSQTGSWALGTTFADFFTLSLQAVAETVTNTANQHVVEDLVDVNWGTEEPAPRIVFDEIGSRRDATAEAIKILTEAGVLTTDEELENFVRTSYSLPNKPDLPPIAPTPPADSGPQMDPMMDPTMPPEAP